MWCLHQRHHSNDIIMFFPLLLLFISNRLTHLTHLWDVSQTSHKTEINILSSFHSTSNDVSLKCFAQKQNQYIIIISFNFKWCFIKMFRTKTKSIYYHHFVAFPREHNQMTLLMMILFLMSMVGVLMCVHLCSRFALHVGLQSIVKIEIKIEIDSCLRRLLIVFIWF